MHLRGPDVEFFHYKVRFSRRGCEPNRFMPVFPEPEAVIVYSLLLFLWSEHRLFQSGHIQFIGRIQGKFINKKYFFRNFV